MNRFGILAGAAAATAGMVLLADGGSYDLVYDGAVMMHFRDCNGCPTVGQAPGEHAPCRAGNMRT